MKVKQTLISSVLAASLLVGAGAALAQDDGSTSAPDAPGIDQPFQGPRGPRNGNGPRGPRSGDGPRRPALRQAIRVELGELLGIAEEYTGLSAAEMREAHQDGQTLAAMIEANGQSVDEFVAAAISDISARIDTAVENENLDAERAETLKANLEEHVTALINGERPVREAIRVGLGELVGLAEEYTGLSAAEMRAARLDGQSLAEMIEANGQSVDEFVDAAAGDVNGRIDTAVENGNLDAERAEIMKANLLERITDFVNAAGPHVMPPVSDGAV